MESEKKRILQAPPIPTRRPRQRFLFRFRLCRAQGNAIIRKIRGRSFRFPQPVENGADPMLMLNQRCLSCAFGDREDIEPPDREILHALNLRFRGRNQWT